MILKKNKKGFMGIVFFFLILFTILIIGIIGVIAVSAFQFTSETITPIMTDLGVVGSTNLTEASQVTFGVVNTTVAAFPWLLGFAYVAMLIFSIIFVMAYSTNPNPVYLGVYFMFVILLIFGSILLSNVYENIYTTNNEVIGEGLKDQKAMSFMILHSPWILTVIAFIVGIYIFAGKQNEDQGGFGI